jgi:hypothetical protein
MMADFGPQLLSLGPSHDRPMAQEHRFLDVFRPQRGKAIHFMPEKMSEP